MSAIIAGIISGIVYGLLFVYMQTRVFSLQDRMVISFSPLIRIFVFVGLLYLFRIYVLENPLVFTFSFFGMFFSVLMIFYKKSKHFEI